jgi:excisionase family DNA binding protein
VPADDAPDEFLTPREAAALLKISLRSLNRKTADGSIPSLKLGVRQTRYRRSQLLRLGLEDDEGKPQD